MGQQHIGRVALLSCPFDGSVDGDAQDDENHHIEDAENRQPAVIGILLRSCTTTVVLKVSALSTRRYIHSTIGKGGQTHHELY